MQTYILVSSVLYFKKVLEFQKINEYYLDRKESIKKGISI